MKSIPISCQRCGAPIKWKENATQTTCEFCGQLNSLTPVFVEKRSKANLLDKTIVPIKNELKNNIKALIKKQNILSDKQVDKIGKIISTKIFKVTLVAIPIALIANSIINDPVRPYKDEIAQGCNRIATNQNTSFNARKVYGDCRKEIKEIIRSLHKITNGNPIKISDKLDDLSKHLENKKGNLSSISYDETRYIDKDISIRYKISGYDRTVSLYIVPERLIKKIEISIETEIKKIDNIIKTNPNNDKAYFKRARRHYILRNYTEAYKDFAEAVRIKPQNKDYLYYAGSASAKSYRGDDNKPCEYWQRAINLGDERSAKLYKDYSWVETTYYKTKHKAPFSHLLKPEDNWKIISRPIQTNKSCPYISFEKVSENKPTKSFKEYSSLLIYFGVSFISIGIIISFYNVWRKR
ncbi:hypothetical protein [Prochlorococcus sp. MIT 1223]|uniref:hypothetical protein n=1 Tax=Prochlorococcus sp. MIT 1223 TaxID=3096217 RepID=UPI002A75F3F4|nr:hypothetical protein [Prochlorococcus sp. MIT 1223]